MSPQGLAESQTRVNKNFLKQVSFRPPANSALIMASKTLDSTVAEISEVKEKLASLWIGFISLEMWGFGSAPAYLYMLVHIF